MKLSDNPYSDRAMLNTAWQMWEGNNIFKWYSQEAIEKEYEKIRLFLGFRRD